MKLPLSQSSASASRQRAVALVVTLLLLSVITFLAVTFLSLSRRERGASNNAVQHQLARVAAEDGMARAQADILARLLALTNSQNLNLIVSTNFVNWEGFDPAAAASPTNVNYGWLRNGNPLTPAQALLNLSNLLYSPRAPVYVTNRYSPVAGTFDFRYYLDLNRNGRYDTNGSWPLIITNAGGQLLYVSTNGFDTFPVQPGLPPPIGVVTNYYVGDPEWIGVLSRPGEPHGPDNQFLNRYAYIVVPTGQALDVNYIHNYARTFNQNLTPGDGDGFVRNQGVGPWEINLAAFLADLNTNIWNSYVSPYRYGAYLGGAPPLNNGVAFDDALSLLRYRYSVNGNINYNNLRSVSALYPGSGNSKNGGTAFTEDAVDGYSDGPFNFSPVTFGFTNDPDAGQVTRSWSGDENPSHFFTPQDFFYPGKTALSVVPPVVNFTDRLRNAGYSPASYDRYTFYRMLAQLGTDSAPELRGKLNLNYDNVARANSSSGEISATNFFDWEPVTFFTNAADRLVQSYTRQWRDENPQLFLNTYGTNQPFGLTSIPVWINNTFVYTPSLHRLLQVAANITDALTNRMFANATTYPYLPSVFRPVFRRDGNNIYIDGYVESGQGTNYLSKPRELANPADVAALQPNDNIYGVPWVIGAKKGLPNFNEFAMQSIYQITRKIRIVKPGPKAPRASWRTDVMHVIGVTNVIGAEAFNSYMAVYSRPVEILVANDVTVALTNSDGMRRIYNEVVGGTLTLPDPAQPGPWAGFYSSSAGDPKPFKVPLRTNMNVLPDSAYIPANIPGGRTFTTNWNTAWDTSQAFLSPTWGLNVTNRLRFIIRDTMSGRIIDYVQLDGLNGLRQVSEEVRDPDFATGFDGLWSTNRVSGNMPQGMLNQIQISLGNYGVTADWQAYGVNQLASGNTKTLEIDKFRVFSGLTPLVNPLPPSTNLVMQTPFTPTRRTSQHLSWQANDPLVHYLPGDLLDLRTSESIARENLKTAVQPIKNIGALNSRYEPWGGNPQKTGGNNPNNFDLTSKDPLVGSSDAWLFPTNKFATLGEMGRIHRGSPWQTIYLKSPDVKTNRPATGYNDWQIWSGNANYNDAMRSRPVGDRLMFDVFTTAINDNISRGLLSVNQSGLAAWSAAFSGIPALTNTVKDPQLNAFTPVRRYDRQIIEPVGTDTNTPLFRIWQGINRTRAQFPGGTFSSVGDILAVPELSTNSPFLNLKSTTQLEKGVPDALYEWLPRQVLGLLRVGEPRFVVYAYGQTLKPADRAIVAGGPFSGMVTNYQVTAEVAVRAVVRVEGSPDIRNVYFDPSNPPASFDATKRYYSDRARCYPPRLVVESYNLLSPD